MKVNIEINANVQKSVDKLFQSHQKHFSSHLILVLHTTEGDWKGSGSETKQSRCNFYQFFTFCFLLKYCLFVCCVADPQTDRPLVAARR